MKAYKIKNETEVRVEVAETIEELELGQDETAEELCDVQPGCVGGFPIWEVGEEEESCPDYMLEDGTTIHTGNPVIFETLDVEKTNQLMTENGDNPFSEWDFMLWVGTFWNGSNWEIITFSR